MKVLPVDDDPLAGEGSASKNDEPEEIQSAAAMLDKQQNGGASVSCRDETLVAMSAKGFSITSRRGKADPEKRLRSIQNKLKHFGGTFSAVSLR